VEKPPVPCCLGDGTSVPGQTDFEIHERLEAGFEYSGLSNKSIPIISSATVHQTLWSAFYPVKLEAAWFSKVEEDVEGAVLVSFRKEWPVLQETPEEILLDYLLFTVTHIQTFRRDPERGFLSIAVKESLIFPS
jgi:hypothetical protein